MISEIMQQHILSYEQLVSELDEERPSVLSSIEKERIFQTQKMQAINNSRYTFAKSLVEDGQLYFSKKSKRKQALAMMAVGIPLAIGLIYDVITGNSKLGLLFFEIIGAPVFVYGGTAGYLMNRNPDTHKTRWESVFGKGTLTKENVSRLEKKAEMYQEI